MKRRTVVTLVLAIPIIAGSLTIASSKGEFPGLTTLFRAKIYQPLEWSALKPPPSTKAKEAIEKLSGSIDLMTRKEIAATKAIIDDDGGNIVSSVGGQDVVMEGYLVPLDFDAEKTSEFLLVSYFGACIHVPPPPPNQIVLVTFDEGVSISSFDSQVSTSFRVSGRLDAVKATTDLADVGYQLLAHDIQKIEEYRPES